MKQIKNDAEIVLTFNHTTNYEKALAHYLIGRVHLKLAEIPKLLRMPIGLGWGHIDEAFRHLSTAAALYPDSVGFLTDYGQVLIQRKQFQEAKQILNQAINTKPSDIADLEKIEEAKKLLKSIES